MWALDIHFSDGRRTRTVRIFPSLEDLAAHALRPQSGVRQTAVELPEHFCSNLEHPCAGDRLLRFLDRVPDADKLEI